MVSTDLLTALFVALIPPSVALIWTNRKEQQPWRWKIERVNVFEFVSAAVVGVAAVLLGYNLFRDSLKIDDERLNGRIAYKGVERVSCKHCRDECLSYSVDADGRRTCSYSVKRCDHRYDNHWFALTDFAEFFPEGVISVPNVDPQGLKEPPSWTLIRIGEPATVVHKYQNILRASGDSIFAPPKTPITDELRQQGLIPPRPVHLQSNFWYNAAIHFIYVGFQNSQGKLLEMTQVDNPNDQMIDLDLYTKQPGGLFWTIAQRNRDLLEANADIGPRKQGNLQIIMTEHPDPMYADAVLEAWNRGSKNDITVFIGVNPADRVYRWVVVHYGLPGQNTSESERTGDNALLSVTLTQRILYEVKSDENWPLLLSILKEEVLDKFNRTPNKEFADLEPGIHPTPGQMFALNLITFAISSLVVVYFYTHDPFEAD